MGFERFINRLIHMQVVKGTYTSRAKGDSGELDSLNVREKESFLKVQVACSCCGIPICSPALVVDHATLGHS